MDNPLESVSITGALGALGDISTGGLLGAGLSALGGLWGNKQSKDAAQSAQDFSAQQFATRYQTTVKDMEAAGLSPMLAYSQGGGSPPTGVSYQAQNPFGSVGSQYQSGVSGDADWELLPSRRRLNIKQGSSAESVADLNNAQIKVVNETVNKVKAEVPNIQSDTARTNKLLELLNEQIGNAHQEGLNMKQQANVLVQTVAMLKKQNVLTQGDVDAMVATENIGREFKQIQPMLKILQAVFGGNNRGGGITINK